MTLSTQERGWQAPEGKPYVPSGHFQETISAVHAIKAELPNTRKRMSKETYRAYLTNQARTESTVVYSDDIENPFAVQPNRVTARLSHQDE